MEFARNLPLRHKLTLLVTLTCGLVVSLACVILAAHDLRRAYRDLETDLVSLARVIGSNSTAALTFDDPRAAGEILAAMSVRPHIVSAASTTARDGPSPPITAAGRRPTCSPSGPPPTPIARSGRRPPSSIACGWARRRRAPST